MPHKEAERHLGIIRGHINLFKSDLEECKAVCERDIPLADREVILEQLHKRIAVNVNAALNAVRSIVLDPT